MRNFDGSSPVGARRAHSSLSGHHRITGVGPNPTFGVGHHPVGPPSRSWHPSPFASDDDVAVNEEPQFYKACYLKQIKHKNRVSPVSITKHCRTLRIILIHSMLCSCRRKKRIE